MLIFEIASFLHSSNVLLAEGGMSVEKIEPSRFSFITSIRIAAACKKHTPNAIFVSALPDAVAAISARKLSANVEGRLPYPVILWIDHSKKLPRSIHGETAKNIAAAVYDSEVTREKWQGVRNIDLIKTHTVIPYPGNSDPITPVPETEKITVSYVGPIGDGKNLKQFISDMTTRNLSDKVTFRVLGTAKARIIMPIVKLARANRLDVEWTGDDYDLEKELSETQAFVPGGPAYCETELRLLANGIPPVGQNPEDILDPEKRSQAAEKARQLFQSQYRKEIFIDRVSELLEKLTKTK